MVPPDVSLNQTVYMKGTRRIDEMAATARQLAFQEKYSYTEGWDDNVVAALFNLGLNKLYDKICQIDNVANIQEYTQDVIAGQQAYDIPQDVNLAIQIMNVRYLYGPQTWEFVTLEQGMIQDRYSYPTNIPSTYCIRNGQILLSPTPNITRQGALIINYQKRMRSLDYRRGSITNTSSGLVSSISNANPAVVTTASNHGLATGQKVLLSGSFQPSQLNNGAFFITVLTPTTFSLDGVDTSAMSAFSGNCNWSLPPVSSYGTITNISAANPAVVTTLGNHGLSTSNKVGISGVFEPSELSDGTYFITVLSPTTFSLNGINTTTLSPFSGNALFFLSPIQLQLNFTVNSQKNINMQANANALLDKIDWGCVVDRNGAPILDAVPINNYNTTSELITCEPDYVVPYASWLLFQAALFDQAALYVVGGDYASTHSELDRKSEDLLIEYVVLRLLRLQSAAEPTEAQMLAEDSVLSRLAIAYRRYRPSVVPVIWQQRLRARSWYWGGRGAY